ncbi:MAG: hypothetical protein MUF18_09360 [Fimbriiglobus sp.]|jgi:predicted nuclease with TOPRIM domain|nr:hypothetical protein [Fimbriiglobus sp.]
MTAIGKFLVLLNAFVSVAVLSWALSAFLTHIDAADAVDATGEKLTEKLKRLNDKATQVQAGYAPALEEVARADARLYELKGRIAARLKQADDGVFYDIHMARATGRDVANPNGLDRVGRIDWTDDPTRVIKGLDDKPLAGVEQMRKNLIDEQKAASDSIDALDRSAKALTVLNAEVTTLDARYAWLDEVLKRHEAEIPVLEDLRVNWQNRGESLQRRRGQLIRRLDDLKGSKVGVSPAEAPSPTVLRLTPNK